MLNYQKGFNPGSKLRGLRVGKVGPKDGNDFIGGNFLSSFNASTTLPQLLPNSQDIDASLFLMQQMFGA